MSTTTLNTYPSSGSLSAAQDSLALVRAPLVECMLTYLRVAD